jgi:hypothetical protein
MRIVKRLHIAKFGMGVKSPYLATGTGGTPMPWRAGSNGGTTPSPKPPVGSGTNLKRRDGLAVLQIAYVVIRFAKRGYPPNCDFHPGWSHRASSE